MKICDPVVPNALLALLLSAGICLQAIGTHDFVSGNVTRLARSSHYVEHRFRHQFAGVSRHYRTRSRPS